MLEIYVGLMSSCGFSLRKCGKIGKCTPQEAKVGLGRLGLQDYHNHIIKCLTYNWHKHI